MTHDELAVVRRSPATSSKEQSAMSDLILMPSTGATATRQPSMVRLASIAMSISAAVAALASEAQPWIITHDDSGWRQRSLEYSRSDLEMLANLFGAPAAVALFVEYAFVLTMLLAIAAIVRSFVGWQPRADFVILVLGGGLLVGWLAAASTIASAAGADSQGGGGLVLIGLSTGLSVGAGFATWRDNVRRAAPALHFGPPDPSGRVG